MKKFNITTIIIFGISLLLSCSGQYDFSMDNLSSEIENKTTLAIPLINASFTAEEFIPDDSTSFLEINEDGFITLVYDYQVKQFSAFDYFGGDTIISAEEVTYVMDPEIFELGMDRLINEGEIYVANPKLTVSLVNYWNIPAQVQFNELNYYLSETSGPIPVTGSFVSEWHAINSPTTPGIPAITELVMDTLNSNIDEFVSALPHHISFSGTVQTQVGNYSVDLSSTDSVELKIEIPLDMRISELAFVDTFELNLSEKLDSDTSKIESFELSLFAENGFPVDLDIEIFFADSEYEKLDSLDIISFEGANVVDGKVNQIKKSPLIPVKVEGKKLNALLNASYLMMKVKINTTNNDLGETVKFYSDYLIGIKVGTLVKLKL